MVYLDLVIGLNFIVDLLLLMGTNSLSGFPFSPLRASIAATLGGVYGGVCLLPGFRFLGNTLWRLVFLALMSVIAFGWNRSALRRGVLFVLLSMALGGIALGIGKGGMLGLIGSAAAVCGLCVLGFHGKPATRKYTRVILRKGERSRALTALHDTGNTLRDPISGESVLVVGADVADEMLHISQAQLLSPLETVASGAIHGLRLIPYRAVGQSGGMLLAMRMDEVLIGGKKGPTLVAFAPNDLGNDGYQALAGGI